MVFSGRRVLVTGAGGFIGSHLVEYLVAEGADVRAMVRYNALGNQGWLDTLSVLSKIDVVSADICDRDSLLPAMKGIDTVFNLAALIAIPYSYEAPASYIRTNIEGTLNVLATAQSANVRRVVQISTSEVYGNAEFVPMTEAHPLKAQSPYAASKIGADKMAEAYHKSFDLDLVTVRPFNVFGPRQSSRAVIPTIIGQALGGGPIKLGNFSPSRDFTFVRDTARGMAMAGVVENISGMTINLGTGVEHTVREVVSMVCEILGQSIESIEDEKRKRSSTSEVDRLLADVSLASNLMNWQPQMSFVNGLEETISWFSKNPDLWNANKYVR